MHKKEHYSAHNWAFTNAPCKVYVVNKLMLVAINVAYYAIHIA